MTTLTPSARPATNSAASDSRKLVDRPNTSIETPKIATQERKIGPARRLGGRRVVASMASSAPTEGAVRSRPRPTGPDQQDVAREHRQQRDGAAEEDREQVQGHGPQQDLVPDHVADAAREAGHDALARLRHRHRLAADARHEPDARRRAGPR